MRIVLADDQQPRSEQLRRILLGEGLTCEAEDAVAYDDLPGRLAGDNVDLVLVAMGDAREEALLAIRTADQVAGNAARIVQHAGGCRRVERAIRSARA